MKDLLIEYLRAPEGAGAEAAAEPSPLSAPDSAAAAPPDAADPPIEPKAAEPRKSAWDDDELDPAAAPKAASSDWRAEAVKGLEGPEAEKQLKFLERYSSVADMAKAVLSIRQKISTGEYQRALPENATEEQIKEHRLERGIPEAPEGYELPLTLDGSVDDMNDDQKAVYSSWQKAFHETGIPVEAASALTSHANKIVEAQLEAQAEHDAATMDRFEDTLRTEMGNEFRMNMKMNAAYLRDKLGSDEMVQSVLNGRMADGTMVKNSVEFAKMVNSMARESGMSGDFETGTVSAMQDTMARKAEIEGFIRSDAAKYTQEVRQEYAKILEKVGDKGRV